MTKPMPLEGAPSGDRNLGQAVNFGIVNCIPSPELLKQMRDEIGSGTASPYLTPLELVDNPKIGRDTAGSIGGGKVVAGRGFAEGEHVGSSRDRNGDGKMSFDEFNKYLERRTKQLEDKPVVGEKLKEHLPFENMTRDENVQHAVRALFARWAEFKRDTRWTQDADMKLYRTERSAMNT
ncbi:MAG: hypothetical protein IT343_06430 [Candidatus Melainabacteria bacterium]|nr:hypothetical protein [Candidatus Melainabacteria bacterium]